MGPPDLKHIVDVLTGWYKTIFIADVFFAIALIVGYAFFWSCGCKIVPVIRMQIFILRRIMHELWRIISSLG